MASKPDAPTHMLDCRNIFLFPSFSLLFPPVSATHPLPSVSFRWLMVCAELWAYVFKDSSHEEVHEDMVATGGEGRCPIFKLGEKKWAKQDDRCPRRSVTATR
ncbi:unnamed protein product [Pleuronectes platessa]|uniref:Uncharacterized protein n=1 Tax=Pleuronectes platessa TaxID=8262 RepID=A0A9N7UBU8_PLEPL|nr:unnamed protein product [Pleuronectes platessa]